MKFELSKVQFENPDDWKGWRGFFADSLKILKLKVESESESESDEDMLVCRGESSDKTYSFNAGNSYGNINNYSYFYPVTEPEQVKEEEQLKVGDMMWNQRAQMEAMVYAKSPTQILLAGHWMQMNEWKYSGWVKK